MFEDLHRQKNFVNEEGPSTYFPLHLLTFLVFGSGRRVGAAGRLGAVPQHVCCEDNGTEQRTFGDGDLLGYPLSPLWLESYSDAM